VRRLSMDCKATVKIGDYSRGGCARGDTQAADHDMGCRETYTPFGLVNEDTGELHLTFGSSAKTSDFIVDSLQAWWEVPPARAVAAPHKTPRPSLPIPLHGPFHADLRDSKGAGNIRLFGVAVDAKLGRDQAKGGNILFGVDK